MLCYISEIVLDFFLTFIDTDNVLQSFKNFKFVSAMAYTQELLWYKLCFVRNIIFKFYETLLFNIRKYV